MTTKPAETNEEYHADNSHVSASMLKTLRRSPRIFEAEYVTQTMPKKARKHFEFGTAVHVAALEPERLCQEYVVIPEECSDRRTKRYKEWLAEQEEGITTLSHKESSDIASCVASLRRNPVIQLALEADGDIEQSYRWECAETSVACKMRPDKVIAEKKVVVDVKTIESLSDFGFANQVIDFGYYLQEAHYIAGAAHKHGTTFASDWTFLFAVVETQCPFRSRAFSLSPELRGYGIDHRKDLLQDYALRLFRRDWAEESETELTTVELTKYLRAKLQ